MKRSPNGFTLIELLVVIVIGSVLVGITLSGFQGAQSAFAVRGAKTMYATLHQLARARSIESGTTNFLIVDSNGDSAFIVGVGGVTDVTHFRRDLNVDMRSTPARFRICMTPRGYADPECPAVADTGISVPVTLEFWQNADSTSVILLPMGQLVGM